MNRFPYRFPDYNVLDKWNTPSWNEQTREVVHARLNRIPQRRFFTPVEWEILEAVCDRIVPQPDRPRSPVPIAPFIDRKLHEDTKDGYRYENLPPMQEAWRLGLEAIDDESRLRFDRPFIDLSPRRKDDILRLIQKGDVESAKWRDLPPEKFFTSRLVHDIVTVYYSNPEAWNEIGFGGPASPRGYVRLGLDRHDPWEAEEVSDD